MSWAPPVISRSSIGSAAGGLDTAVDLEKPFLATEGNERRVVVADDMGGVDEGCKGWNGGRTTGGNGTASGGSSLSVPD